MADETERRTERVPLVMTPSEVRALDDWAFNNRIRGRGEAIRRLIEAGLKGGQVAPLSAGSAPGRSSKSDQDAGTGTSKPPRPRKSTPRAKPLAMSKEAQLRAMRERGS